MAGQCNRRRKEAAFVTAIQPFVSKHDFRPLVVDCYRISCLDNTNRKQALEDTTSVCGRHVTLKFEDMLPCGQPARIQTTLFPLCVYRTINSPKQPLCTLQSPVSY